MHAVVLVNPSSLEFQLAESVFVITTLIVGVSLMLLLTSNRGVQGWWPKRLLPVALFGLAAIIYSWVLSLSSDADSLVTSADWIWESTIAMLLSASAMDVTPSEAEAS